MAIRIDKDVRRQIHKNPGHIAVQVLEASDGAKAILALQKAGREIAALDGGYKSAPGLAEIDRNGPKYVSGVFPTTLGPFITVDGGLTPLPILKQIPDIIARHLRDCEVTDARISTPTTKGPLLHPDLRGPVLRDLPNAVVLRLYPRPPYSNIRAVSLAPEVLDAGSTWLKHLPGEVLASVVATQFSITTNGARSLLEDCRRMGAHVQLVSGDLSAQIRAVQASFLRTPNLVMAGGGPGAGDEELLQTFYSLREIARTLAPHIAYAFIAIDPTFLRSTFTDHPSPRCQHGGAPSEWLGDFCDEVVIDAYPYQILGPLHRGRFPTLPPGLKALSDNRFELALGDPRSWLRSMADAAAETAQDSVLEEARSVLQPCFISFDEAYSLVRRRWNEGVPG